VEKDAKSLASALLMPAAIFAETFNAKWRELEAAAAPQLNALRETLRHAGDVFQVSPKAAAVRARKLKLITLADLKRLLPDS
jgi:Zn-dependent peptidase ImmA (M78 family)